MATHSVAPGPDRVDTASGAATVDVVEQDASERRPRRRDRRRRRFPRLTPWWIRLHRWSSLVLGLALLVEAATGCVLLFEHDIATALHPDRYRSTPSAQPMGPHEALDMVRRTHPELAATGIQQVGDVYVSEGESVSDPGAFVDPGTGTVNAVGVEQPWFLRLMVNIHDCAMGCEGYPGYQAWVNTPMPGGPEDITIGYFVLGGIGVFLIFLVVSGIWIWWPGLRRLASGFVVRRGRGGYVRDLDLHKLVGIVAVPFLLMWGVTAAAFFFQWPERVYAALTPGSYTAEPVPPAPGTGKLLTYEQALATALRLHPGATMVGYAEYTVADKGGTYDFRLRDGVDPYRYSAFGGNLYVSVDSHGGGSIDYANTRGPLTERWWDNGVYSGLHFGTIVPLPPRLVWLLFGLTPVLLAVTGVTVWLTKWRSRRARRRRRQAEALTGTA